MPVVILNRYYLNHQLIISFFDYLIIGDCRQIPADLLILNQFYFESHHRSVQFIASFQSNFPNMLRTEVQDCCCFQISISTLCISHSNIKGSFPILLKTSNLQNPSFIKTIRNQKNLRFFRLVYNFLL